MRCRLRDRGIELDPQPPAFDFPELLQPVPEGQEPVRVDVLCQRTTSSSRRTSAVFVRRACPNRRQRPVSPNRVRGHATSSPADPRRRCRCRRRNRRGALRQEPGRPAELIPEATRRRTADRGAMAGPGIRTRIPPVACRAISLRRRGRGQPGNPVLLPVWLVGGWVGGPAAYDERAPPRRLRTDRLRGHDLCPRYR